MTSLQDLLNTKREVVVTDLAALIDASVESSSGISGMALKGALGAAKKVNADIVQKATNKLLPEILSTLDPYWSNYQANGSTGFGAYLDANSENVVNDVLAVVDRNAEKVNNSAVQKAYSTLRSKANKLVAPHIAALGDLLERHAG